MTTRKAVSVKTRIACLERSTPSQAPACWRTDLPGVESAATVARKWAAQIAADTPHGEALALIVSELVTNAYLHSMSGLGGTIHVEIDTPPDGSVYIEVADEGPRDGCTATNGFGLVIVEALATECGQTPAAGGGRRAWAYIDPPDPPPEAA